MRKYYWLQRQKPASYLISDCSQPSRLEDRYIQDSGIHFVPPPSEPEELFEALEERTEVRVDCQVSVEGMSCGVEVANLDILVSGNEPTERLKNKKPAIHQRVCAYGPDLGHDPRYGGWIDPFEFVSKPKKKPKTYDYY